MVERTKISLQDGMQRGFRAGYDQLAPEGLWPWTGDGWLEPYRAEQPEPATQAEHPVIYGSFDIKLPPDGFKG